MAQIKIDRTIKDINKDGSHYEFVIPDLTKMMRTDSCPGDEFIIPIHIRDNQATFWELGGKNDHFATSIGTIIANNRDKLLNAVLFNKFNKRPSSKQAMVAIRPGYRIYVGRINTRQSTLAPKIKMFQLVYAGIDDDNTTPTTTYGRFTVNNIFTQYKDINNCFPARRLVHKLCMKDVRHPYFANGWTTSNISKVKEKRNLLESYIRLLDMKICMHNGTSADEFLDEIEDHIAEKNNKHLSAVLQLINFETGMVILTPLSNMRLSNIGDTINNASATDSFKIPISEMLSCYNNNILFNSTDIPMLEVAMEYDDKFSIEIAKRAFCILRGYRG